MTFFATVLQDNPLAVAAAVVSACVLYIYTVRNQRGLGDIPGPFLASLTDLYRLWDTWTWKAQFNHQALHRRYGKFVRYGPNLVSISDPAAIPDIYGINARFNKSDFYKVQATVSNGKRVVTTFNAADEALHAKMRKPIAHAYAMSSVVDYEPRVDAITGRLCERLDELYASTGAVCDLGEWVQFYAFDTIASMSFSAPMGFIDTGADVEGTIRSIEHRLSYSVVVGQMPWLDEVLEKNPLIPQFMRGTSYIIKIGSAHIEKRLKDIRSKIPTPKNDFLAKFIAGEDKVQNTDQKPILSWTASNLNAGSDTTAIALRSIFYFLLKHPSSYARLRAEADAAPCKGAFVSWAESRAHMPYLDAVVHEALRLHPAVGLLMERVVPAGGRTIGGRYFAAGTIVGMSPWITHYDRSVYGEDVDQWRPERWLEATDEQRKMMDRTFLAFGAGTRSCIGKNVSKLEMYKLVPHMIRTFDMELAYPDREWKINNAWFVKQTGVLVKLKRRQK